jgi:hypothetical protein
LRGLIAAIALLSVLVLAPTGCRIKKKSRAKTAEDDGQLASIVNVADPRAAVQLIRGFHGLENESWRWTMKNFAVTLRPPANAAQKGASLELKFTLPDVMFNRVGAMTLDARINGVDLGPETYPKAGDFTYSRHVPEMALHADGVTVEFAADKGLPPGDTDPRELAVIVTTVGLLPK